MMRSFQVSMCLSNAIYQCREAYMKHKVKMMVETEKQSLFGKKKVLQERTVEVDSKTYQKMQKEMKHRSLSFEEIMWLDELLDDDE